eukprot:356647-Chlamydomonas_euryale.AAC.3
MANWSSEGLKLGHGSTKTEAEVVTREMTRVGRGDTAAASTSMRPPCDGPSWAVRRHARTNPLRNHRLNLIPRPLLPCAVVRLLTVRVGGLAFASRTHAARTASARRFILPLCPLSKRGSFIRRRLRSFAYVSLLVMTAVPFALSPAIADSRTPGFDQTAQAVRAQAHEAPCMSLRMRAFRGVSCHGRPSVGGCAVNSRILGGGCAPAGV